MPSRSSTHHLSPQLHYAPSDLNRTLLEACPSLRAPYRPTFWAKNTHVQLLLYTKRSIPPAQWDLEQPLLMQDGGTVSLQWKGLSHPQTTENTPVLLVLPTITGCGETLHDFVDRMQQTLGWIVVVCNRRGHGKLPLTTPRINTLGNTDDLRQQIEAIQQRRPDAPLMAFGISAGSGLLARYLGEEGCSPLRAGVLLCPAYEMRDAFYRLHWLYDRLMTRYVIRYFLHRHEAQLKGVLHYKKACQAKSFGKLHDLWYALAGYQSMEAYYKGTNPMEVAHNNRTPALVINAIDDPICTRKSLEEGIRSLRPSMESMMIAVTRYGSHCAFFEGNRPPRSWAEKVTIEYLQAALALSPGVKQGPTEDIPL